MSMALTSALNGGETRDRDARDQGFPGRLGASVRVWMREFGTPELDPLGLAWPMDDGLLIAAAARHIPAESPDATQGREPISYIERRWESGREPDLYRALEVADSLLPGDAEPMDHAWMPMPEAGHPLAGHYHLTWRSAQDLFCPAMRDALPSDCPYSGAISLTVRELAPDKVAGFWIVAMRNDATGGPR